MSREPKIIQYANVLHKHGGPDSKQAKNFRTRNASDKVFTRRAKVLDRLSNCHRGAICEGPHNYDELIKPRDGYNDQALRPF